MGRENNAAAGLVCPAHVRARRQGHLVQQRWVGVSIAARAHRPSRCLSPRLQHPAQDLLDTLQAAIADRKLRRVLYLIILDIQEEADGRSKTPWTLLNGDRS